MSDSEYQNLLKVQLRAAQVFAARRANKAEATAHRFSQVLDYASSIMGPRRRGMLEGFAAGLDKAL